MGHVQLFLLPFHSSLDRSRGLIRRDTKTNPRGTSMGDCDTMVDFCDTVVLWTCDY